MPRKYLDDPRLTPQARETTRRIMELEAIFESARMAALAQVQKDAEVKRLAEQDRLAEAFRRQREREFKHEAEAQQKAELAAFERGFNDWFKETYPTVGYVSHDAKPALIAEYRAHLEAARQRTIAALRTHSVGM